MDLEQLKARRTAILFARAAGDESGESDAHELERIEAEIRDRDASEAAAWEATRRAYDAHGALTFEGARAIVERP